MAPLVERAQLGVLALALLLRGDLRRDVDEEALGVHRPARVAGNRDLVVHPDRPPVVGDMQYVIEKGSPDSYASRCAACVRSRSSGWRIFTKNSGSLMRSSGV